MNHSFESCGWIRSEHEIIDLYEQIVHVMRIDTVNNRPEAVEYNENAYYRKDDVSGQGEKRVDPAQGNKERLENNYGRIDEEKVARKGNGVKVNRCESKQEGAEKYGERIRRSQVPT